MREDLEDAYGDKTPLRCLRSVSFWLLVAINGIGSGAGLALLNNLGELVRLLNNNNNTNKL